MIERRAKRIRVPRPRNLQRSAASRLVAHLVDLGVGENMRGPFHGPPREGLAGGQGRLNALRLTRVCRNQEIRYHQFVQKREGFSKHRLRIEPATAAEFNHDVDDRARLAKGLEKGGAVLVYDG